MTTPLQPFNAESSDICRHLTADSLFFQTVPVEQDRCVYMTKPHICLQNDWLERFTARHYSPANHSGDELIKSEASALKVEFVMDLESSFVDPQQSVVTADSERIYATKGEAGVRDLSETSKLKRKAKVVCTRGTQQRTGKSMGTNRSLHTT